MLITAMLLVVVMRRIWGWKLPTTLLVLTPLILIDTGFFVSNVAKFGQGGWVPVAVALLIAFLMQTWMSGRRLLAKRTKADEISLDSLIDSLAKKEIPTVPETAIFMTSKVEGAPTALLHSLKHYNTNRH